MKKQKVYFKRYFTVERGEFEEFHTARPEGDAAYIGEIEITAEDDAEFEIYENIVGDNIISNGESATDLHLFLTKRAYLDGIHYRTTKDVEKMCQY